jgi:peptide/nickel transport system permease protein
MVFFIPRFGEMELGFKKYILFRLLTMAVVVLVMLTIVFFAIHIIPGDPVANMVGEGASEEYLQAIRHELGLDLPIWEQYFNYMAGVFTGNLGQSIILDTNVSDLIWQRAGVTIQLSFFAWILSVILGVGIGRFSAQRSGDASQYTIHLATLFLYAIPVYVLGILCQLIFGVYLNWLPLFGTHSPRIRPPNITGLILIDMLIVGNFAGFVDALLHFLLPSLVLAASYVAVTIRLTHSETVKSLKRTYCLLAEAKGLDMKAITVKHAFRNALLPVVTLIGMQAGSLLTGSILIETVFSLNGLGSLLFTAASMRDYILTQGVVTVFVLITSFIGLLIDISYYFLDPRVRY